MAEARVVDQALPFSWIGRYPHGFWFIEATGAILDELAGFELWRDQDGTTRLGRHSGVRVERVDPWELISRRSPMPPFDIDNTFTYHAPKGNQNERYQKIREAAKQLAHVIVECSPESAEQTLALRDVQRAVMMANMNIATNE